MAPFDPPGPLVTSILNGRCVAFVGAGFAAGVMPGWGELLQRLAAELRFELPPTEHGNAFHYEAVGQKLRDRAGDRWEPLVQGVLAEYLARASPERRATLERRRELLLQIPFKAILTTNFDPSLETAHTQLGPPAYAEVLREERGRWWNAPRHDRAAARARVIKLHGDANGDQATLPLVLGRADYRRRIYEDRNYANFVRSVFAQYTVLFLGVSFTDAYLNELRSEVLHLVYERGAATPWGYAVVYRPSPLFEEFLRTDEGIQPLRTDDHAEFDRWLEAIADRTSVEGRLRRLLAGHRIVWVDRNHAANNQRGLTLLRQAAEVEPLDDPQQLDPSRHADASLILTSFGHAEGLAFSLLDRVRTWPTRPPVIVFASPHTTPAQRQDNRTACLRRGAWEYTSQWSELYRAIELAVGRVPGLVDAY